MDALEHVVCRRPNPAFPTFQRRQTGHDLPRLVDIGVALHPILNRLAILRTGELQGDHRANLGKHVLMQHCRALCDHERSKSLDPATADDPVEGTEQALLAICKSLCGDLIGFVDDEVKSGLILGV
ncbi:hypothetical protein [Mesorhizobium amorphae]